MGATLGERVDSVACATLVCASLVDSAAEPRAASNERNEFPQP